jgi:hypothetical protein
MNDLTVTLTADELYSTYSYLLGNVDRDDLDNIVDTLNIYYNVTIVDVDQYQVSFRNELEE